MYLSDNEWQQRVLDLLRMSRVVLLRTGITRHGGVGFILGIGDISP